MPKIPEYGQSQVASSASGANLPNAPRQIGGPGPLQDYRPTDSFGVAPINPTAEADGLRNMAQGLGTLATGLARFAERRDAAEAEEAIVQFEREKNRRFFDPEGGYFNTQGRDAYDRAQPTLEELGKLQRETAATLKSPRAQALFNRAADQHITRAEQDIMRYASDQFRAYERGVIGARIEQTVENALLTWNDPQQRAVQLELGRQAILDLAVMTGESPEVTAENLQNYQSRFGVATIEAALANSALAGQAALADNMELLEPHDVLRMQEAVDKRIVLEQQQREAQTAVAMANSMVQQYGEEPNARRLILEEVEAVEQSDPALGERLRREALARLSQYQQARSEEQQGIYETVEVTQLQGGTVDQFIAQNPVAWSRLTLKQQANLLKPGPVVTDFAIYSELMMLPREELAKVNPADYMGVLAPSDRQRLLVAVKAAQQGDTTKLPTMQSLTAKTTAAAEQIYGARTTWKSPGRKAQVQGFMALVESEAAYRTRAKGAELTPTEYNALLNDVTRQIVTERPWYQPDKVQSLEDVEVPDHLVREGMTPTDYLLSISEVLHQQGLPVTSDNILRIHNHQKSR